MLNKVAVNLSLLAFCFNSQVLAQFPQNFDSVTPPNLPTGWTSERSNSSTPLWVTQVDSSADTSPNSVFINNPSVTTEASLVSPTFSITGVARLLFRHSYNMENFFDGGVLEISVNGGPFQDFVSAGGSFITGAYNGTLSASGNPLATRQAWTGSSGGMVICQADLPASLMVGDNVQLRWRRGTDVSVGGVGWTVDSIELLGADLAITLLDSADPIITGGNFTYSMQVVNRGTRNALNTVVRDYLPLGLDYSSTSFSQGSATFDGSNGLVTFNLGTVGSGATVSLAVNVTSNGTTPTATVLTVNSPAEIARDYHARAASFGPPVPVSGIGGGLVRAFDGISNPYDACAPLNPGDVLGKIVLIDRSPICSFEQAVFNAQSAGALAAIFKNNDDSFFVMSGTGTTITIPTVLITRTDGEALLNTYYGSWISAPINVTLASVPNQVINVATVTSDLLDPSPVDAAGVEFTTIASDTDGDGTIDPLDGCPASPAKISPGVCGCNLADLDSNANAIIDCKFTDEFEYQVKNGLSLLKKLKLGPATGTQKKIRKNLKSTVKDIAKYADLNALNISVNSGGVNITFISVAAKKATLKALKLGTSFAADKKSAAKALKAILASLA